jgi:putative transposase
MSKPYSLTAADWQHHIEAQPQSGLTQVAYCQAQGLSLHAFRDRKYRSPSVRSLSATAPWLELPLAVTGSAGAGWQIELDLGNGLCLRLKQG